MSGGSAIVRSVGFRSIRSLMAARSEAPLSSLQPVQRGVLSPWQTGTLSSIVWSDVFGTDSLLQVTRAEAMTVPAIAKARAIIVGQLAGAPLQALRGTTVLPDAEQPAFLYRTNGAISPWHRNAWTFDDLLFNGWALWEVVRGSDNTILSADRVPPEQWKINPDGSISLYDQPANANEILLFPGPNEGLLTFAARTIRAARRTDDAWQGRVRNPVPIVELHQVSDDALNDEEVDELLAGYVAARSDVNGAVTYTPPEIEIRTHGEADPSMLVEARNALRVDVANFVGLPAASLDGSVAQASLTYVTQDGKMSELGEGLRMYAEPFEARLSQDDVVPRGQRVRMNMGDRFSLSPSPTGPEVQD